MVALKKKIIKNNTQVHFSIHKVDSLNNRFKPLEGEHTKAIFSVDDDMRVPCSDLHNAFNVWKASPDSLVGYMPRMHLRRSSSSSSASASSSSSVSSSSSNLEYRCWWRVWWHGKYSIILTKAAIFHSKFLTFYTNEMSQEVRNIVDKEQNCEDIAMQFMISNITKLPPIYIRGNLQDLGAIGGISTRTNIIKAKHMDKRSQCLNVLVNAFGKNPLIFSRTIVTPASNWWTNMPSTWLEFISSDLWNFF